jgi:hypothetical protein
MKRILKLSILSLIILFGAVLIQSTTYAWYVQALLVYYEYEDGITAATTYRNLSPVYGETYHIDSPEISGYKPDKDYIECYFTDSIAFWVKYYPVEGEQYNLVINYIDTEGNKLADSYNESLGVDTSYNIDSPVIKGYTANLLNVSGTITSDTTIDVIYAKNKYDLVINYYDDRGNIIADPYSKKLEFNDSYEVTSPVVYGFKPMIECVSGVIEDNTTVNVYYSRNNYRLIIYYVDEFGNTMSEPYHTSMQYGNTFDTPSPVIYGYTPDYSHIEGVLDRDLEYTVTYSKNDYVLTIKYIDQDGNNVADDYVATLKYNDPYEVESPIIPGHDYNIDVVSGVLTRDTEIIVNYVVRYYTVTINYVDSHGNILKEATRMTLRYNSEYEIITPEIDGYYTNENNVSSQFLTDNVEINIVYTKCSSYSAPQLIIRIASAVTGLGLNFTIAFEIIRRKKFFIK